MVGRHVRVPRQHGPGVVAGGRLLAQDALRRDGQIGGRHLDRGRAPQGLREDREVGVRGVAVGLGPGDGGGAVVDQRVQDQVVGHRVDDDAGVGHRAGGALAADALDGDVRHVDPAAEEGGRRRLGLDHLVGRLGEDRRVVDVARGLVPGVQAGEEARPGGHLEAGTAADVGQTLERRAVVRGGQGDEVVHQRPGVREEPGHPAGVEPALAVAEDVDLAAPGHRRHPADGVDDVLGLDLDVVEAEVGQPHRADVEALVHQVGPVVPAPVLVVRGERAVDQEHGLPGVVERRRAVQGGVEPRFRDRQWWVLGSARGPGRRDGHRPERGRHHERGGDQPPQRPIHLPTIVTMSSST